MRLKALEHLKYKEIPDEWVKRAEDLTEDETKRFIIADNVGFGEWDFEQLANEWDVEELSEWGLDLPFQEMEIEEIDEINESCQVSIVCKNIDELEKLKYKLGIEGIKVKYDKFCDAVGL